MLKRAPLAAFLSVTLVVGTSCSRGSDGHFIAPPPPATPSPTPSPNPGIQEISIGATIKGAVPALSQDESQAPCASTSLGLYMSCQIYTFTAPQTGTVTATLTFDTPVSGNRVLLRTQDHDVEVTGPPWPPITGHLQVVSGRRYSLEVAIGQPNRPQDGDGTYALTTVLE